MRILTNYIAKSINVSDGLKLYYEISYSPSKDKKYILFIHGLGGDASVWDQERVQLQSLGYTTIAIDLRGHGLSQRAASVTSYNIDRFALDVLEIIKQENINNISIVGHCFGGIIALTLEALYPKSSRALILVDTTYKAAVTSTFVTDHKLINKIFMMLGNYVPEVGLRKHKNEMQYKGTGDININRFFSDVIHTSLKSYFLIYNKFLLFDATSLLSKITVPTLIIVGTNDTIFPESVAKILSKRIKNSELDIIEGANHILVLNNPSELVLSIYNFLLRLDNTKASNAQSA